MKNYLLNALMAGGIVIGISLGGAALGIALKDKKTSMSASVEGKAGLLSFVGGFKPTLTAGSTLEKAFFEHFGFDGTSGEKDYAKVTTVGLDKQQIFDGSKITADIIAKFLKAVNGFKVTKNVMLASDLTFSVKVKISLNSTETKDFKNAKHETFTITKKKDSSDATKFVYSLTSSSSGNFKKSAVAAGGLAALIGDFVKSDKDNFVDNVFYSVHGKDANEDGTDLQYAVTLNKKTGALYFFTKQATKAYKTKVIYVAPTM